MRILLTATPSPGNAIPLRTIGMAAHLAGHDVAILTASSLEDVLHPLPVLPAGPALDVVMQETARRSAESHITSRSATPQAAAEHFVVSRLRLAADEGLQSAREWEPDLIVAEVSDPLGPLAASMLDRPWASHTFGVAMPDAFTHGLYDAALPFYQDLKVIPQARVASIDPWPALLHPDGWISPADHVSIAPTPLTLQPDASGDPTQEHILVTFGTQVQEPAILRKVVESLLAKSDLPLIVTRGSLEDFDIDDPRVSVTGFVPLTELLQGATAVVTVGGFGTVLAALQRRIPIVVLPFFPSQVWVAERLRARGIGLIVDRAEDVGRAVQRLWSGAGTAALDAAAESIEALDDPTEALRKVLALAGL